MSRGIDIKGIDLVINYDVPGDAEDYVHRIGRTARAKTEGMAVTLVCADDMFKFSKIEQLIDRELEKDQPPTELGEGPSWKGQSRGKSGSKGGGRNNRGPKREQSRAAKDGKPDRKPPRSKTEGDAPKREKKKREPTKYRLIYDALPNPKKGKPAGSAVPEVKE
jgi:superfamily II DNA/RNA helicase